MSLYRRNKFGENIEVERYECGSCANYEFEREDQDNYCRHYGKYYPYRDSCRGYWEEFSESSSSGCFLTSACCEYMGLPDNCEELTVMRSFRDEVLCKSETGKALKSQYYMIAPEIVKKIDAHHEKAEILKWIYEEVQEIVKLVKEKKDDMAISRYVLLVYHAEEKANA